MITEQDKKTLPSVFYPKYSFRDNEKIFNEFLEDLKSSSIEDIKTAAKVSQNYNGFFIIQNPYVIPPNIRKKHTYSRLSKITDWSVFSENYSKITYDGFYPITENTEVLHRYLPCVENPNIKYVNYIKLLKNDLHINSIRKHLP